MELLAGPRQVILGYIALTRERPQSRQEEFVNCLSHALGLAAALAAGMYLITTAAQRDDARFVIGVCIYAATLAILYLASTLYHGLPEGRTKNAFLVVDHSAIYLFIAGSYTPFAFGALRGPWGLTLLAAIWVLALAGVAFKVIGGATGHVNLSTAVYVAMGWVLLLGAIPVWHLLPPAAVWWLLAGGAAYTLGIPFFRAEGMRYGHFIWHCFVLAGTICHYVAILWFAH